MSEPHFTDYILQTTSEGEDKLTKCFKSTGVRGGILAHKPQAELSSYKTHYEIFNVHAEML